MNIADQYTARALADLRFGETEHLQRVESRSWSDPELVAQVASRLAAQSETYAEELLARDQEMRDETEAYVGQERLKGGSVKRAMLPPDPGILEFELFKTSQEILELEHYRRKMVAFANYGAVEKMSKSEVSRKAGITRVTTANWMENMELGAIVRRVAARHAAAVAGRPSDTEARDDAEAAEILGLLHRYAASQE